MIQEFEMDFLPPSTNSCYRVFGKRVIKSKKLREFERQVEVFFNTHPFYEIKGKIRLGVHFQLKGNRNIDLDNMLKALIDGLQGYLFDNDKDIYEIIARKSVGYDEPKTILALEKIE